MSVSTLRRKRPELKANGAVETDKGWRIPVTALIALELMSRTTDALHEGQQPTHPEPTTTPPTDALTAELDALRSKLADAERRAAVAEAVAAERERLIQSQAMSLRMLEGNAPPVPTAETPIQPPTDTARDRPQEPAPKPRWKFWR